jgi:ATP-dependent protease Clp ATPase subunit
MSESEPQSQMVQRYVNYCSWCAKHYQEVGPLVEGPNYVYICQQCIILCAELIEKERARRGLEPLDVTGEITARQRARSGLPP